MRSCYVARDGGQRTIERSAVFIFAPAAENDLVCVSVPFSGELCAWHNLHTPTVGRHRHPKVGKGVVFSQLVEKLSVAFRQAAKSSFLQTVGYAPLQHVPVAMPCLKSVEVLEVLAELDDAKLFNLRQEILQKRVI